MKIQEIIAEDLTRRDLLKGAGALAATAAAGSSLAGANDMKGDSEWKRLKPEELQIWKQRQSSLYNRATAILYRLKSKMGNDIKYAKNAKIVIHSDHTVYAWAQVRDNHEIEMDLPIFWDLSDDCIAYVLGHELGHIVVNGRNSTNIERRKSDTQSRKEEMACDIYGAKLAYGLGYDPKKAFDMFSRQIKDVGTEGNYPGYSDRITNVRQQTGIPVASVSTPNLIQHNMNAIKTFLQAGPNMVSENKKISTMKVTDIISEVFDQPYAFRWDDNHDDPGADQDPKYDAYLKLPDGGHLEINFYTDSTVDGNEDWVVEFWRDRSLGITGAGDQQRVFATVLTAIGQFIEMEEPETLRFTADKDVEPGQKPMSRSNLYDRLVQRYAQAWGYRLDRSDMANTTVYLLHRIR